MLHAERGICAPTARLLGAVVLHIVPDYRALPFVSSANPYYEVLGAATRTRAGSRIADLQLVVYGWSLQPIFTSGRVAWLDRQRARQPLYQIARAVLARSTRRDRLYHVYFMNDRAGVYALGYPSPDAACSTSRGWPRSRPSSPGLFRRATSRPPLLTRRSRAAGRRALARAVPRNPHELLPQAVPVLRARGGRAGAALRDRVRRVHDRQVSRRRRSPKPSSVVSVARRVFEELSAAQARPVRRARARPTT